MYTDRNYRCQINVKMHCELDIGSKRTQEILINFPIDPVCMLKINLFLLIRTLDICIFIYKTVYIQSYREE